MRANVSDKEFAAAWAAVREVERLASAITARTEAPKLLWRKRHAEHAALVAELKAEEFDPNQPLTPETLRRHAELANKVQVYEKLSASEPREFRIDYGSDGVPLMKGIEKLQKLIWSIAEPFELRAEVLIRHGICGLGNPYTPESGARRLLNWSRNFTHDGAFGILSLAKEILSRKVPAMPPRFGTVSRNLTYAEQQAVNAQSEAVQPV